MVVMRFISIKIAIFAYKSTLFLEENEKYTNLIFPPHNLRTRKNSSGEVEVWVPSRGAWLVLTPEEEVRRRVVRHLSERLAVPATHISEEHPVRLNGQPQRADIVVFDGSLRPWLVVECKAPDVALSQSVLDQVVRYNSVLGAPQVMVTNGRVVRAFTLTDRGTYAECDFPV